MNIENVETGNNIVKFTMDGTEYFEFYDETCERLGRVLGHRDSFETEYALSDHFDNDEVFEIVDQLYAILDNAYENDEDFQE